MDRAAREADLVGGAEAWLAARPRASAALAYGVTALVALVAFAWDTAIFTADLRKPLVALFSGDGASFAIMHFKGVMDDGYFVNPYLGAPFGMDLHDFPSPDLFYLATIWVLTKATRNWALAWNLLYIASYPLAAVTALAVMRRYGLRTLASMPGALLFAFVPFHATRAFGHVHLGLPYFLCAVATIPALDVLLGERCGLDAPSGEATGLRRFLPRVRFERRDAFLFLVAFAVGLWQIYYWYFATIVLVLAGVAAAASQRAWLPLVRAGALAGASAFGMALQLSPVILFQRAHGRSPIGVRSPGDAEAFALKIAQLVFPMDGHRFEVFRRFRRVYDLRAPLVNENGTAYLGLVGVLGLVVLLLALFAGRSRDDETRSSRLAWPLAVCGWSAILLGTMGGLGSIIAFLVFPEMRSYNRISVFVAFYAFFAVSVVVDRALDAVGRGRRALVLGVAAAVTAFGIHETTFAGTPDYDAVARESDRHAAFVADLEAKLPAGAMVLELPYMRFPESAPVERMEDYTPGVPYLYSKRLRWSYGAMRDRRADDVYERLAKLPPSAMLDAAVASGFSAIYVVRSGFVDRAEALERELRAAVGEPLAERWDHDVTVWPLVAWGEARKATLGPARVEELRRATLEALYLGFRDGFSQLEMRGEIKLRFVKGKAKLTVENPTSRTVKAELTADYWTTDPNAQGRRLVLDGVVHVDMEASRTPRRIATVFDVPPGVHLVTLRCDAKPSDDPNDWRQPVLVFQNYALRELPPPER